jgi:hypothetical protein
MADRLVNDRDVARPSAASKGPHEGKERRIKALLKRFQKIL